ncbi:hypothetical protein ABZ714_29235 [Streptomyces sp. NPDC006798]|uniref:hypothetical protein n=1 Tax=Streptomyces sp. NPDC006798 TaxID=3155462 RepID=UPI0033D574E9
MLLLSACAFLLLRSVRPPGAEATGPDTGDGEDTGAAEGPGRYVPRGNPPHRARARHGYGYAFRKRCAAKAAERREVRK